MPCAAGGQASLWYCVADADCESMMGCVRTPERLPACLLAEPSIPEGDEEGDEEMPPRGPPSRDRYGPGPGSGESLPACVTGQVPYL
jgi:hypothetical protein